MKTGKKSQKNLQSSLIDVRAPFVTFYDLGRPFDQRQQREDVNYNA